MDRLYLKSNSGSIRKLPLKITQNSFVPFSGIWFIINHERSNSSNSPASTREERSRLIGQTDTNPFVRTIWTSLFASGGSTAIFSVYRKVPGLSQESLFGANGS